MSTRTRRDFFRLAGVTTVGGSAVLLAACGDDDEDDAAGTGTTDTGGGEADVAVLNSALDLEHLAVAAYTAGVGLLRGEARQVGELFLAHEQEHVDGLTRAIRDLGGTPNRAKAEEEYAPMFAGLGGREDVLRFAVDLENTAVAAYIDALPKLTSAELRRTAAAITANEAEHLSVLLGALGEPQVPDAFVTGAEA